MAIMDRDRVGFWLRWGARFTATLLLLFWGAVFVEHLAWLADFPRLPPVWVLALHGLHLSMLVGFLVGWRWERAGAALVLCAGVPYFYFVAGRNFPLYAAVTAIPALLWLAAAHLPKRRGPSAGT